MDWSKGWYKQLDQHGVWCRAWDWDDITSWTFWSIAAIGSCIASERKVVGHFSGRCNRVHIKVFMLSYNQLTAAAALLVASCFDSLSYFTPWIEIACFIFAYLFVIITPLVIIHPCRAGEFRPCTRLLDRSAGSAVSVLVHSVSFQFTMQTSRRLRHLQHAHSGRSRLATQRPWSLASGLLAPHSGKELIPPAKLRNSSPPRMWLSRRINFWGAHLRRTTILTTGRL